MRYSQPYHDLVAIQRALMADAVNPETTPSARAQVARAFTDAEEMKRIIAGKPNPKPVEVSKPGPKSTPRSSFTESPGPLVASAPVVTKPETPQA